MHRQTHPDCNIRAAATNEARFLSELALRSKAHWGYSSAFIDACRDELTYTPEQIGNPGFSFAVAEVARAVAGFYALQKLPGSEFELDAMFVEPRWIGHGVGRALLDHAKRAALELGGTSLVIQGDPNAVDFYKAAGAVITGMRESGSIPGRFLPTLAIALEGSRAAS